LGARARGVDVGLEIGVHQLEVDAEHLLQHAGGEVGALLTGLADEAEIAGARQDHADSQLLRLRSHYSERWNCAESARGSKCPGKSAAVHVILPGGPVF